MAESLILETHHARPWMLLVERYGIPEHKAKDFFDRIEPCKSMEERYQATLRIIREVESSRIIREVESSMGYFRRG